LSITSILWLTWFFLISGVQANARQMLTGVMLCQLVTSCIVGQLLSRLWSDWSRQRASPKTLRHTPINQWSALAVTLPLAVLLCLGAWRGAQYDIQLSNKMQLASLNQVRVTTWIAEHIPADAPLAGWGWYTPWGLALMTDRVPATLNLNQIVSAGQTGWFVITPELAGAGPLDPALRDVIAHQPPPLYDRDGYQIFQISDAGRIEMLHGYP
jgi:hypothetical protein